MRKITLFVLLAAIAFLYGTTMGTGAKEVDTTTAGLDELILTQDAKSAILIEPTTLAVIYEKNADNARPPASMTKIMTMTLIMEALKDGVLSMDQMLTCSEHASGMGGTNIYLEPGEKMSVEDLLKSVAINSANDAAVVFAEAIGGTEENFVAMMNRKAKAIGCKNTVFKNANGLPEAGHVSSARDMALMGAFLINNYPEILKYTSIYEDYVRENSNKRFWLVNTNKLVKFVEGVDGLKTGWTDEAGYCLTATIKKDGNRFIAVCMGNSTTKTRNAEIMAMLNYAVNTFDVYPIVKKDTIIRTIEDVRLYPKLFNIVVNEDVNILLKKGSQLQEVKTVQNIRYKENIENHNKVGTLKVYYNGDLIKEVDLIIDEEIKKASYLTVLLEILKEIFLVS